MSETIQNILEIGLGLLYSIGAIFNSLYTLKHGEEFFGSFASGAWLPLSRRFVKNIVIPNSRIFTILMIFFQVIVAVAIFSRGELVGYGLIAGAVFNLGVVLVSNPTGAIASLILAAAQAVLAYLRLCT
jgi:hypothetical protein